MKLKNQRNETTEVQSKANGVAEGGSESSTWTKENTGKKAEQTNFPKLEKSHKKRVVAQKSTEENFKRKDKAPKKLQS